VSSAIDRLPTENFSAFKSSIESHSPLFYLKRGLRPFRIKTRFLVFFGGAITAILVVIISSFNFFAHPEKLFLGFDSDRSIEKILLQEASDPSFVFPVKSRQVSFEKHSLKRACLSIEERPSIRFIHNDNEITIINNVWYDDGSLKKKYLEGVFSAPFDFF